MQGLGQPEEYLRKAKEAEERQQCALDPDVWEAWERVVIGYLDLATFAARRDVKSLKSLSAKV